MNRPKPTCGSLLVGLLLSVSLTSCSTMLNILFGWDECNYPGCNREARKGSNYCPMHDYEMQKNNFDRSWDNTRKKAAEQTGKKSY